MKSIIKTSAIKGTQDFTITRFPAPTFGAGFQQFLTSAPALSDDLIGPFVIRQPMRYLEAVPAQNEAGIGEQAFTMNVAETLSDSLGAAILISARPTTKSLSLAHAVNALRAMHS